MELTEPRSSSSSDEAPLERECYEEGRCYGDVSQWNGAGLRCRTHGGWWPLGDERCDRAEVPKQ